MTEFPRTPTGILKRHITDEADNQLAKFVQYSSEEQVLGVELPTKPQLPDGIADAPLVRLYNFLRELCLLLAMIINICLHYRDDVTVLSTGDLMVSGGLKPIVHH